jgi:hypothetical protein
MVRETQRIGFSGIVFFVGCQIKARDTVLKLVLLLAFIYDSDSISFCILGLWFGGRRAGLSCPEQHLQGF